MVSNKKGISAIVATVLIILITVAGIAIIWAAIIPMINERVDFEATDVRLTINVEGGYTTWNENSKIASVQIKRGVDDSSDLSGIQVIFGMPDGVSVPFQLNESEIPGSNQMKVYHFNLSEKPLNVKIAPIFDGVIGEVSSETDYFGSTTKGLEVGDVFYSSNGGSGSGDGSGDGTTASTVECVSDSGCTGATEECMKNVCIGGVCGESVDVGAICDAGTCNSLGICEGCLGIDRFGLCDGDTGTCNSNDECVKFLDSFDISYVLDWVSLDCTDDGLGGCNTSEDVTVVEGYSSEGYLQDSLDLDIFNKVIRRGSSTCYEIQNIDEINIGGSTYNFFDVYKSFDSPELWSAPWTFEDLADYYSACPIPGYSFNYYDDISSDCSGSLSSTEDTAYVYETLDKCEDSLI